MLALAAVLGLLSFGVILAEHNITDADLWAKLALGAHVWKFGTVPRADVFAFTPTLPEYVDHEWGAGTIFFVLLKFFGPASLMWLKIALAFAAIIAAFLTGLRFEAPDSSPAQRWPVLLVLAIPASACIMLGYVPVIRSHSFTYFFFAVTLFCLESLVHGERSIVQAPHSMRQPLRSALSGLVIVGVMLVWANVHGGFVAGLGTIAVYACVALIFSPGKPRMSMDEHGYYRDAKHAVHSPNRTLVLVALSSLAVTCINPYGAKFWGYLLPALLAKRAQIAEWQSLPLFAVDVFMPFRILFFLVLLVIIVGWKKRGREGNEGNKRPSFSSLPSVQNWPGRSWTGLIMLAITAYLGWRSRRHAPFFGIAALAFAGPYAQSTLSRVRAWVVGRGRGFGIGTLGFGLSQESNNPPIQQSPHPAHVSPQSTVHSPQSTIQLSNNPLIHQSTNPGRVRPATVMLCLYGLVAVYAAIFRLPLASFQVLSPVGHDPVREADILSLAQAEGNLATPFHWGSYLAWRLYPRIKISMDGRYEAAYPESTFQLNNAFFDVNGPNWDHLMREYPVDFVILDLAQERLRARDLLDRGYVLIWKNEGSSALLALQKHAAKLRQVASQLPPTTINPLDPDITDKWWKE